MDISLPLKEMTIEEKIQAMEIIWEDLCKKAESLPSPAWHEQILSKREDKVKNGDEKFVDWQEAKKNIRDSIS